LSERYSCAEIPSRAQRAAWQDLPYFSQQNEFAASARATNTARMREKIFVALQTIKLDSFAATRSSRLRVSYF
jgi:hypothetical protein